MNSNKYATIEKYLIQFLIQEITKTGLTKAVVGLSGGIDSAVVAVLLQKAFGKDFLAVLMPSQFSSQSSIDDAVELCEKFDIRYETVSIAPMLSSYITQKMSNLRVGNLSARLRMCVLYDISARESALVVGTSNKSELMLGYGTLFGDLSSALNPIGDLYKSEIFEFARHLGVVDSIIEKPPSADLWEGQSDEEDLGYTYAMIDEVLREFIEERLTKEELIQKGYAPKLIQMIQKRVFSNHFKRVPPIVAKLTSRSIGSDFLYARDILL
jgi:NAD+ synthase